MKHLILFIVFIPNLIFCQSKDKFKIENIELKMDNKGNGFFAFKKKNSFFFEDENYIVTDSCRGEFGGNIYFKNKANGKIYSGYVTCPLIINKIKKNYYLTYSLSHMSGSCGFLEITNPEELILADEGDNNIESRETKSSEVGMKPLYFNVGSTIVLSFVYKDEIFHIVTDRYHTYLAKRENAEMVELQIISKNRIYSYNSQAMQSDNNHYVAIFQTGNRQGYIDVFENVIKVYTYN